MSTFSEIISCLPLKSRSKLYICFTFEPLQPMENTLKEKICEKQKEIDNLENEIVNEIKENFTEVKDEIMAHCTKFEEIKKYNKKVIEDFYEEFNESL